MLNGTKRSKNIGKEQGVRSGIQDVGRKDLDVGARD